jgi:hypothetical protein
MEKSANNATPDELLQENLALKQKLKKRNEELSRARFRLRKAKAEISRLKEIVTYQRGRIVELH